MKPLASVTTIDTCEVCGSSSLHEVLDLGCHPLCDDLVEAAQSRRCEEYPIEIVYCGSCGTAHQRAQVPKQLLFPKSYHYRARFTQDVLNGMDELVQSVAERLTSGLAGKLVLDVGCNDGSLLSKFRAQGCKTVGVEPTGAAADAIGNGHTVINAYFDSTSAAQVLAQHGAPEVITFTNVFAHIEDLPALLDALRLLWTPKTQLIIENHNLDAVLRGNQFDTFYHEHPRTYSSHSFAWIATALGARVQSIEFPKRYGGNIRVHISSDTGTTSAQAEGALTPEAHLEGFAEMRSFIQTWKVQKRAELLALATEHGPLPAKAFPGRAAILVKLLGLDEQIISATYERPGSMKIGHFVPGTRIPIRDETELFAAPPPPVMVNFAWHISAEIKRYLTERGLTSRVVDLL